MIDLFGKISGKYLEGGTNWTFTAASYTGYDDAAPAYTAPVVAKCSYKATEIVKGKKKTVTKCAEREFSLAVSPDLDGVERGVARMAEVDGSTVDAWQNLWGQSDYKALGKQLFSTKSGKKTLAYRTWASIAAEDLGDDDTLSVKVITSGAVTATYRFFKGTFDKKGKPQYATYTCATTLIPLVPADAGAEGFEATAIVVFPPVPSVDFPGCAAEVDYHCDTFFARVRMHADAGADDDEGGAGHAKVQLWAGGPYWATTNIGAENPEDYGYHFWWGDTVGYKREGNAWAASDGSSSNFSFDSNNTPTNGKSDSTLRSEGWITADGVLSPEHDAAHVLWGGDWRMPTKQELDDLSGKCDWTWSTHGGVRGFIVSGKGVYASNSIFLPASGIGWENSLEYDGSYGYIWSSSLGSTSSNAWDLYFHESFYSTSYDYRYRGRSVRPVQGGSE